MPAAAAPAMDAHEGQPSGQHQPSSTFELPPSKKLYVGNVFFDIKDSDLRQEFEAFGPIESCRISVDYKGFSKGWVWP